MSEDSSKFLSFLTENKDFFYNIENIEEASQKLLQMLPDCCENDDLLIDIIFTVIYNTSNFKRQTKLINDILNVTSESFYRALLTKVIKDFDEIPVNRRDKFFYLISKTYKILSLEEVLNVKKLDVLQYLIGIIDKNIKGWNDEIFLRFLIETKPYVASEVKNIKINKNIVETYLKNRMCKINRTILYSIMD